MGGLAAMMDGILAAVSQRAFWSESRIKQLVRDNDRKDMVLFYGHADNQDSRSQSDLRAMRILATDQQQTWLVRGSDTVHCVLDDRRREEPRVQWSALLADVLPVRADETWSTDAGVVRFGQRTKEWLYSKELFRSEPGECPNFCVRGLISLTHHWAIDCKRRMTVAASHDACSRLFLGLTTAPVPSSRPANVPAAAREACQIRRLRRDRSHAQPLLGGEHGEDPRFATGLAGGATMWARRRGASLSHGHSLGAAEPRRWRPDRDRSYPEVLTPWHCRAGCRARLRTRRRIRPGPRSFRPKHHSSASTGFAAPPPRGVSGAAAVEPPAFWRGGEPGVRRCSARRNLRAYGLWAWLFSVT